jgi:RimJ/RimL family protein N-acetyltransferase
MIVTNNVEYGYRVADRAGAPFNPNTDICIARVEDGELWGGVTYTGYTGASIQMHMAGFVPRWADRAFLWAAFHYPFVQIGCRKVFGQVPESNTKALEIDKRLGFKEVARIEDVFSDGACIILALAREDCRWLKQKPSGVEFIPHSEA